MVMLAGTAMASNMAFKINTTLFRSPNCTTCDNWISLPFSSSFVGQNIRALCDSNGDGVVGAADTVQFVTQQNSPNIDAITTHSCTLSAGINNPPYQPTRAVRLRIKTAVPAGNVQIIHVGSDVPGTQILLRKTGGCATCDNWIDMVYHTTFRNLRDACDTNGNGTVETADQIQFVTQQGTAASPGAVDSITTHSCTLSPSINNPLVQVGRGLRIRLKAAAVGDLLYSEPHF
jgi:hypothetical protein